MILGTFDFRVNIRDQIINIAVLALSLIPPLGPHLQIDPLIRAPHTPPSLATPMGAGENFCLFIFQDPNIISASILPNYCPNLTLHVLRKSLKVVDNQSPFLTLDRTTVTQPLIADILLSLVTLG